MCRERWEVGILRCVTNPLLRLRKPQLTQNGDPLLVACFIEKAAAKLKVFCMRPQWREGQAAPTFISAILFREHLGHARPVSSSEVESDIDVVRGQVMGQATVEARAIDVDHFPTNGWVRGDTVW